MDTHVTELVETPQAETPAPEAPLSIMEHASQFGPAAKDPTLVETAEEKEARIHHSAEQRREKQTGQFAEGKIRHRAQSQKAGPEDAPRIQKLTAERHAAEERAERLEAELNRLKQTQAPPAVIAKAEAKVEAAGGKTGDPEPDENDAKYGGDYGKYLRDLARWEGRQAYQQAKADERQQAETAKRQETQHAMLRTFSERTDAAKAKYPDYDAVAYGPTPIKEGSPVDAWIMEDEAGPDVLYYLQSHRQELDSLLAKPVLQQLKDLTLLSQRLLSSSPVQAGTTGSAAGAPIKVVLPPRPPNPVRTEAQRAGGSPPPTDGSLSLAEHAKHFGKHR